MPREVFAPPSFAEPAPPAFEDEEEMEEQPEEEPEEEAASEAPSSSPEVKGGDGGVDDNADDDDVESPPEGDEEEEEGVAPDDDDDEEEALEDSPAAEAAADDEAGEEEEAEEEDGVSAYGAAASSAAGDDEEEEEVEEDVEMDQDDEEEEEVLAAVVVADDDDDDNDQAESMDVDPDNSDDDDEEEAAAAVVVVEEVKKKPAPSTTPKSKSKPSSSSSSKTKSKSKAAPPRPPPTSSSSMSAKKSSNTSSTSHPNKKKKKSKGSSSSSLAVASPDPHHPRSSSSNTPLGVVASPQCLAAARDARAALQEMVPSLPYSLAEIQVRSFGRLPLDPGADGKFATAGALFPVGFSCDRFEFSPVHGRVLRVRCSILDGRRIRKKQRACGIPLSRQVPEGPIFRLLWGQAIDEDILPDSVEYPYSPHAHSAPLTGDPHLAVAVAVADATPSSSSKSSSSLVPERGMRVKVRYDRNQWHPGTIARAVEWPDPRGSTKKTAKGSNKKNAKAAPRKRYKLSLRYDDGSREELVYPDPDVSLLLPGVEEDVDAKGNVELTTLNGKSVTSVWGRTPLEAWGKALIQLGLVDEIMLDHALDQLQNSRRDALQEAKERLEGTWQPPVPLSTSSSLSHPTAATPLLKASAPPPASDSSVGSSGDPPDAMPSPGTGGATVPPGTTGGGGDAPDAAEADPPSEREKAFREFSESLLQDLDACMEDDREAAVELADARIGLLGQFLCNPFHAVDDPATAQEVSWLATAVRKEKMKMGSTGNRKKVVTALDLLERNDTLYNADIEALIEGLPGSEYCQSYVFQAFRPGNFAMNRQWLFEAQLKREKESMKRSKRMREAEEKEHQEQEKQKKRQERDDVRDARKRQKLEEEDSKKRARIEERLSRLKVQIDERLHNEASFQREKVISVVARNLVKEFARRRKAAETVAAQAVVEMTEPSARRESEPCALPQIAKPFDEDSIRVWNFMTTFGSFFIERGFITEVPSLDSLQAAIEVLRQHANSESSALHLSTRDAISSLTDLAVALCKPLATSLTRILFASLIALNPTLQKDFGAAFFNEVNAAAGVKDDSEESPASPDVLLPVNAMTWQEVARISLLSDALGELGYQRHEAAHILRGYRSAGHPNSKEARRLRKSEDIWVALVRQEVELGREATQKSPNRRLQVPVPCEATCLPVDCIYFLHNIKSLCDPTFQDLKANINAALNIVQSSNDEIAQNYKSDLMRVHQLVEEHASLNDVKVPRKVKNAIFKVLEKYAGVFSNQVAAEAAIGEHKENWPWQVRPNSSGIGKEIGSSSLLRQRMGLIHSLEMDRATFKLYSHQREVYMEEALVLKEQEKWKMSTEEDEDEDDFDEEDEKSEGQAVVIEERLDAEEAKANLPTNSEANVSASNEKSNSTVEAAAEEAKSAVVITRRIGKPTEYDDFCGDIPAAPELLRRCLAVLRTVCGTSQASGFLNPVDPQANPGYYDIVLRPMCLREVGNQLTSAADNATQPDGDVRAHDIVEAAVAQFGRSMRLIEQNTLCYANAGPTVISMASELLRIFERLFLDWVLAPQHLLPPLTELDDDKCVEHHTSDDESTVLFCDGCEGKYNISRLDPPLAKVPKGDWYCPRCVSGRWWGHLDPRVGNTLTVTGSANIAENGNESCVASITACSHWFPEKDFTQRSLMYTVDVEGNGTETWTLSEVDVALAASGVFVPPICCLDAVVESPGYGNGVDLGLRKDLVPIPANPRITETSAELSLSSSIFRDTITTAGTLLVIDPEDMTANEWLRLLVLLTVKCSSSDVIQSVVSKMESTAAESMLSVSDKSGKVSSLKAILPDVPQDGFELEEASEPVVSISNPDGVSVEVAQIPAEVGHAEVNSKSTFPLENGFHHDPIVVETSTVEVVENMDAEVSATVGERPEGVVQSTEVAQVQVPFFTKALMEKKRRQKTVEDSIAAYCIKSQLRPTLASFEEDRVSQVVDSSLTATIPGLDFASVKCRRTVCDFCGLTDVSLGSPLVRVPNEDEWLELMPHTVRNRRVRLVAAIAEDVDELSHPNGALPKMVCLTIRLDGDIFSVPDADLDLLTDGGMIEFVPRADVGFQNELSFRDESGLPFVTGSMSAHDCCAAAAHNSRKELMLQRHKERQAELIEKEAGMTCGRTLEIGRDTGGRSYWKFFESCDSLFVTSSSSVSNENSQQWHRYDGSESIASVMFALGKDRVVLDLKHSFPDAAGRLKDGSWKTALLSKRYARALKFALMEEERTETSNLESILDVSALQVVGGFDPYDVGEEVLVESKSGSILWDAQVTGLSKRRLGQPPELLIDAYRVQYSGWGSRFVEWVEPRRVVEPNENNKLLQGEMNEEQAASRCGLPAALNFLSAKEYLLARDRARGISSLPDFARIAQVDENASSSAATFAMMKTAVLAVEAALPLGSVDNSESGPWNMHHAQQWRYLVEHANGSARLMQCVILLEDMIGEEWIKQDVGYLRTCLPARWKAVLESSPSALAIRIIMLDRSILYGMVDRKRYNSKKKAGRPGKSQES